MHFFLQRLLAGYLTLHSTVSSKTENDSSTEAVPFFSTNVAGRLIYMRTHSVSP